MVKPFVFQISGYQNTGKTTVVTKLIEQLKIAGLTVSVLKHHGHGGEPELPDKDSTRHLRAGAQSALVEGDGTIQLTATLPTERNHSIENLLEMLGAFNPDVILIEGYKNKPFPKALIIKHEQDLALLRELRNMRAVLCWPEITETVEGLDLGIPIFEINSSGFFNWFLQQYRTRTNIK